MKRDHEAEQPHDRQRNFRLLLVHGFLGQTGFRLLQAPTIVPTYVSLLTGSPAAVGAARAIQSLGMFLSPILAAHWIEHRPRIKRYTLLFGGLMRLQVLALALIALFAPRWLALWLVWPFLGLWGLASGLQAVGFGVLTAKSVPTRLRGRLQGLRNLLSGLTVLLVSIWAGYVLERYGFPTGYGLSFLAALILATLGLAALAFLREPEGRDVHDRGAGFWTRLRAIPELTREDRNYRLYLQARLIATAARGVLPLYVLTISERYPLSGAAIATLTICFTTSQGVSSFAWGLQGDRSGYRVVFLGALGCWIAGSALTLWLPSFWTAYVVYVLVGMGFGGLMLASFNLVLEFGRERDMPMRIASSNSFAEAAGALGFLAAGLVAQLAGFHVALFASIALQVLAITSILAMRDPRAQQT